MSDNSVDRPVELSVVILAYKAGQYIVEFTEKLQQLLNQEGIDNELIIVANYRTDLNDETPAIVKKHFSSTPGIRLVSEEKQGMMGWDMQSGMQQAKGKYISVIDGDGQMPPEDVLRVYQEIATDNYDLVKTYREKRYDGWFRILLSVLYNWLFQLLYHSGREIKDVNSKPKIFSTETYKSMQLSADGWFIDAEMMIVALRQGLRIKQIPTVFYKNQHRGSFVGLATGVELLYNLIYYKFFVKRSAKQKTQAE